MQQIEKQIENNYTICYKCGQLKKQCTCKENNPDERNPTNNISLGEGSEGSHSGGSGSSSNNNTQEDDTEERSNSKRIYSIEQEIGFAKKFSKRVEAIIEQLQSNKKIEIMDIENPKYDPEKKCIFLPQNVDFTISAMVHELIHYYQDSLNMTNIKLNGSDVEYQAYVLNYILQKAKGEMAETPQGVKGNIKWEEFESYFKSPNIHCGNKNNEIWIDSTVYNELQNLDHKTLSQEFRDYYKDNNKELEVYWNYHDPEYKFNWKELFDKMGVIIKP